jgi:hypothetical protein
MVVGVIVGLGVAVACRNTLACTGMLQAARLTAINNTGIRILPPWARRKVFIVNTSL